MGYIDTIIGQTINNIQIIQKISNTNDRAECRCTIHNVIFNSSEKSLLKQISGCQLCINEKIKDGHLRFSEAKFQNFIGKTFGNLQVVDLGKSETKNRLQATRWFKVKCLKHLDSLEFETTKEYLEDSPNPGCDICKVENKSKNNLKHGYSSTKEYIALETIILRTTNLNNKYYKDYGGRGIDIDPRYDPKTNNQGMGQAFSNFYEDIGDIPLGKSIDRKDNGKGYWKYNIRFSTPAEQAQNTRKTKLDEVKVRDIRSKYASGQYNQKDLSVLYSVSECQISHIINYKSWKNII